jgi:hypothetical protein
VNGAVRTDADRQNRDVGGGGGVRANETPPPDDGHAATVGDSRLREVVVGRESGCPFGAVYVAPRSFPTPKTGRPMRRCGGNGGTIRR